MEPSKYPHSDPAFCQQYAEQIAQGAKLFKKGFLDYAKTSAFAVTKIPSGSIYDRFSLFYEAMLIERNNISSLYGHYFKLGHFDLAKKAAEFFKLNSLKTLCDLHSGHYDRIEALETPPSASCDMDELSTWLRYHKYKRTLNRATANYSHCTQDGNALILLYKGNFTAALSKLKGDSFEDNIIPIFKAYCFARLSNTPLVISHVDESIKNPSSVCAFETFDLFLHLHKAIPPHLIKKLHLPGTEPLFEVMYFGEDPGQEEAQHLEYVKSQMKYRPNPCNRFFSLLIAAKKANAVAAHEFFAFQKDEPVNIVDFMILDYYFVNEMYREASIYAESRQAATPHPLFLESQINAKGHLLKKNPENKITLIAEMEALIQTYEEKGYEQENILTALGELNLAKQNFKLAEQMFTKHIYLFGPTEECIIGLYHAVISQDRKDEAVELIIKASETFKHPDVLTLAEKLYVIMKEQGNWRDLYEFYAKNLSHRPSFAKKISALNEEFFKCYLDKDTKELSQENLIRLLELKIAKKIDLKESVLLLAHEYFKIDQKDKAIELIKKHPIIDVACALELVIQDSEFLCHILPVVNKRIPLYARLAMMAYFLDEQYDKVLEHSLSVIKESPDDLESHLIRAKCFFRTGNHAGTRYMLEVMQSKGWMNEEIESLKEEFETKIKESETASKSAKPEAVRGASKKPSAPAQDRFKLEMKDVSDAKKVHLERRKAAEVPAMHTGSKSVKGAVDPLIHVKSSRFDPKLYKPKDEEPETQLSVPAAALKPVPKEAPQPLFALKLNAKAKARVEYTIERFKRLIHLEELVQKGNDPSLNSAVLFRNHLYTYLRTFGILTDLANAPLKDHLYNIRNQARHEFIVASLSGCQNLLNYLKDVKLNAQLEDWANGGMVTHLAVSPYSLLDKEKNRLFEQLPHAAKSKRRIEFMKEEIVVLKSMMEPIKTFELFQREDFYQNAVKISLMMIAKSWTKLTPDTKKELAPYFRDLNLDGNKSAHQFKKDTEHDNITFHLDFEDISIERLWKFAEGINELNQVLNRY